MNANVGGNGKGGDGAWFDDANKDGPPEDDVFGATDAEKEEEKRAEQEEQQGQEYDAGIQIPAEDGKVDVEFEGPEKHMV